MINPIYHHWRNSQKTGQGATLREVAQHFGVSVTVVNTAIRNGRKATRPVKFTTMETRVLGAVMRNGPEAPTAQILAAMRYFYQSSKKEENHIRQTLSRLVDLGFLERVCRGKYSIVQIEKKP